MEPKFYFAFLDGSPRAKISRSKMWRNEVKNGHIKIRKIIRKRSSYIRWINSWSHLTLTKWSLISRNFLSDRPAFLLSVLVFCRFEMKFHFTGKVCFCIWKDLPTLIWIFFHNSTFSLLIMFLVFLSMSDHINKQMNDKTNKKHIGIIMVT
jgi:hypothetical protein